MTDKKDYGTPYKIVVPTPIAYPIFDQASLDKARARGIKVDQWGGKLGFEPDDTRVAEIKKLMAAEAKKAFPNTPISELRFPLASGATLMAKGKNLWAEGKVWLTIKKPLKKQDGTVIQPPLVKYRKDGHELAMTDFSVLQSGALVACELTFKGTKGNGSTIKDGVTCYVNSLFFARMGEPIGGRGDIYADVEGKVSDENPLEDNDEIPF